ncbi:hypothetical protein CTAYLR_009053 [Chrysophaeum taylorii]|uniref:Uncharacterized protein n=1 Tax=Chrysophaeum taylorii TaxID=2483200 RepID=A0AAD7UD93_9STRA|nr:hypothetical protein CTAYLR_009053 [Chrysophaeum taylorii]
MMRRNLVPAAAAVGALVVLGRRSGMVGAAFAASIAALCVSAAVVRTQQQQQQQQQQQSNSDQENEAVIIPSYSGEPASKGIDVLVHNVSHSDVVISFGTPPNNNEDAVLARPRFGTYSETCEELFAASSDRLAFARRERRDSSKPEYPVVVRGDEDTEAAGLALDAAPWPAETIREHLKVRRCDMNFPDRHLSPRCVFFPILAIVLRAWLDDVVAGDERIVVLVTGTGTPRDESLERRGNSTEAAGKLAAKFIELLDDRIRVRHIHSETNVFRYDENISFVRHELEPAIASLRAASLGDDDWSSRFRLSASFGDGAPARVSTIHRSLRPYKPTCIHVWQPKTFWEKNIITKDDVEVLPFAATETVPAQPAAHAEGDVRRVVAEMRRLAQEFHLKSREPNDMARFWHRKSRKVVFAVLLVRKRRGGRGKIYHGTNMEVSMPTGSLCAERNVIGTALADDVTLHRSHLRIIAVLGLHLPDAIPRSPSTSGGLLLLKDDPPSPRRRQVVRSYPKINRHRHTTPASTTRTYAVEHRDPNPLKPCGACCEWLKKIASINPDFSVVTFTDADCQGLYVEPAILY